MEGADIANDRFLERLGFIQPQGQPIFGSAGYPAAEPLAYFCPDSLATSTTLTGDLSCQGMQPAGLSSGYGSTQAPALPMSDSVPDFLASGYWCGDEVCDLSLPSIELPQDSNTSSMDIGNSSLENIYWQPSVELESLPSSADVQIPFPDFPSPLRLDAFNPDPALVDFCDSQQGSELSQQCSDFRQQCSDLSRQCSDYSSQESAQHSHSGMSLLEEDLSDCTESESAEVGQCYTPRLSPQPSWTSKPSPVSAAPAGTWVQLPCTCGARLQAAAQQLPPQTSPHCGSERSSGNPFTCSSPSSRVPPSLKAKPGASQRPRSDLKKSSRVQRTLKLQSPVKAPSASHTRGPVRFNRGAVRSTSVSDDDDEPDWEDERRPRNDRTDKNKRRKQHNPWTLEETTVLVDGVEQCGGGKWADIKKLGYPEIEARSAVDLKDKWRNLLRIALYQSTAVRSKSDKRREIPKELLQRVRRLVATNFEKTSMMKHPKLRRGIKGACATSC